jgi:hypothetical protein
MSKRARHGPEPRVASWRWTGVRLPFPAPLLTALAAAVFAACGGGVATPTPSPAPLVEAEIKYRVIDELGTPWFCDPDFHPVARADEREIAVQRFAELQKEAVTFGAIRARLKLAGPAFTGDEQLAIYREWKILNALPLQRVGDVYGFAYLAKKGTTGERVDGRVSARGQVTVLSRTAAGPPPCPICLALGTRIATPRGDVAVELLRIGDVIWTQSERGERIAARVVIVGSTPVPPWHEVVRLGLADGRVVLASPGHPTADGRTVGVLGVGDFLDGAAVVSSVRVRYVAGATYDLRPAGATGAYWANGVLLGTTLR